MNLIDLFERARRPSLLQCLEPHQNDENVFVTFTDVIKLGIYPKTQWTDPLGIYAYPVREMFDQFSERRIPYAGHRRYAYIFRNTGNMLELNQLTDDQMVDYIGTIEATFEDALLAPPPVQDHMITDPVAYWEHAIQSWLERFGGGSAGECFWEVTRKIASHIEFRNAPRDIRMIWSKLFQACGIDAVSDRGQEIISLNEPAQAVFLNTRAIKPIEVVLNDLGGAIR